MTIVSTDAMSLKIMEESNEDATPKRELTHTKQMRSTGLQGKDVESHTAINNSFGFII